MVRRYAKKAYTNAEKAGLGSNGSKETEKQLGWVKEAVVQKVEGSDSADLTRTVPMGCAWIGFSNNCRMENGDSWRMPDFEHSVIKGAFR